MNTTARQAALKILLEEVEPLVVRLEEAGLLFTRVDEEFRQDLGSLGQLVQNTIDAQGKVQAAAQQLLAASTNLQTITAAPRKPSAPPAPSVKPGTVWLAVVVAALLSSAIVGGAIYALGRDVVDQARIGRALQQSWPSLDEPTRKRIEQVINK